MTESTHLLCFLLPLVLVVSSHAKLIILKPQNSTFPFPITTTTLVSSAASCSYTVTITTSCSSPSYTQDQISLSFGDSYGNQVYAPRLDDPSSGAFERCSVDTYDVSGPCLYEVCYLYLYRSGSDGWEPESVEVDNYYIGTATFFYDTYIPNDIWYGFNYCTTAPSASSPSFTASAWFLMFAALFVAVVSL